jgi:hypothetical protein
MKTNLYDTYTIDGVRRIVVIDWPTLNGTPAVRRFRRTSGS